MQRYYRVMLGKQSAHAALCLEQHFIGADYGIDQDLTGQLPDEWRAFNARFIPVFLAKYPDRSRIGAGLACGALWTLAKGIDIGDVVLSPVGSGRYRVGDVVGDYHYAGGEALPHRRAVRWREEMIDRGDMSEALRRSTGATLAVVNISVHAEELQRLLNPAATPHLVASDPAVEDPTAFALEKHLEDFLVTNWQHTSLGQQYDIYEEDGELVGQQYPSDTGPMDILAVSKDRKTLLVVELKKGRASDVVVGQVLRYMGYALQELADEGQEVRGVIVALEDDVRLRRTLAASQQIDFYRYTVSFKLTKV